MPILIFLAGPGGLAGFLVWFLIIALFLAACALIVYYIVPANLQRYVIAILVVLFLIAVIYWLSGFTGNFNLR